MQQKLCCLSPHIIAQPLIRLHHYLQSGVVVVCRSKYVSPTNRELFEAAEYSGGYIKVS